MKIGISGVSGQLGMTALKRLKTIGQNFEVVGISRTLQSNSLADQTRYGDYDKPDSLMTAYAGLDRLLIISSLETGHGVRARQLVSAIDCAVAAGVGHIVLISDVGTRLEPEPCIGAASWAAEQRLIKNAPAWTIIRANYFMESFAQEVLLWKTIGRLPELGEHRIGFVSRDDVAHSASAVLAEDGHVGAIYHATGPTALTVAQRAKTIRDVTGADLEITLTSVDGLRDELRLAAFPEDYLDIVLDTKRKAVSAGFDMVTGDVELLTGQAPTQLRFVMAGQLCALPF